MWRNVVTLILLGLSSTAASAEQPCPIEQARYSMIHYGDWSAGFRAVQKFPDWQSDLAFFVHSAESNEDFWFVFDQGNGHHTDMWMISTTDVKQPGWHPPDPDGGVRPLGQFLFYMSDADLKFARSLPSQGDVAPMYVFLPNLTRIMWYYQSPRLDAPLDMFKLIGCAR